MNVPKQIKDGVLTVSLPISFSNDTSFIVVLNSYGQKKLAEKVFAYTGTFDGNNYQTKDSITFWEGVHAQGRQSICVGY